MWHSLNVVSRARTRFVGGDQLRRWAKRWSREVSSRLLWRSVLRACRSSSGCRLLPTLSVCVAARSAAAGPCRSKLLTHCLERKVREIPVVA